MCQVIDSPTTLNEAELQTMERRWYSGELQSRAERVLRFAERDRADILQRADPHRDPAALIAATQSLIRELRSLDQKAELRDQMREIDNQIWIDGEHHIYDRDRIVKEWAENHAEAWRDWLVKEYLYCTERLADEIVAILLR